MALETLVRSINVVKNRFPQNYHFYSYVSRELAVRGRKVNPHKVRVIFKNPKRITPDITSIIREAHKTIRADSGLHDNNFLPVNRSRGPRICREIHQIATEMIDWYRFMSKRALARYISHELSVGYNLVNDLLVGVKRSTFTPDIIKVNLFMRGMIDAAERAYQHSHAQPMVPSAYVNRDQKSLAEIIDKSVKKLFEGEKPEVANEAVNYIKSKLKAFAATGQLAVLSKQMKEAYRFPNIERYNSFACDMAEIERREQLKGVRSGLKEPYSYHRKLYAVSLALDYTKKAGLYGKVRERIGQQYLPLSRKEYKEVIDKFILATHARPYIASLMLAQQLGMNPEAVRKDYLKMRSCTMPREKALKIKDLEQHQPFFIFNMGPKGTNDDERKRFMDAYKRGSILVDYEGTSKSFDRQLFAEITYFVVSYGGNIFFHSRHIGHGQTLQIKDYRQLFNSQLE